MTRRNGSFRLYGRNVIVTGAAGGLGSAMTRLLITRYGCRVLGVGRSAARLKELQSALGEGGAFFRWYEADVSERETWRALAEEVRQGGFPADVLINNAGMLPPFQRLGDGEEDTASAAMRVNFDAVLYAMREFLPLFGEREDELTAIVNIASADALCPLAGTALYSAAKAGVLALTECVREEYRGRVYLPAVCPGFIRTDIMKHQTHAVGPLVKWASMPSDRAARVILRRVNAGRSRIVVGADAHLMAAAYRITPVLSQRLCRFLMAHSGVELFADIS